MAPKTKTHHITAKTGKPPGMNYADFLAWKKMIYEEAMEAAKSETNRVLADRQAQRLAWLYLTALNERFGFDERLTDELETAVKELTAEYEQYVQNFDQDYADEVLRRRVSQVRGHEVKYLYEDQYPVNKDLSGQEVSAVREQDSRIY